MLVSFIEDREEKLYFSRKTWW